MIPVLFKLLLAIVTTEAVTEIIVKSELFYPVRRYIFKLGEKIPFFNWLHSLLDCGYCFSVWSSALVTFLLFRNMLFFGLEGLISMGLFVLFIHRLSNLFHGFMDRI